MPSSPMLLQEHLMHEAQPPISAVAEEIAPGVAKQMEWIAWGPIESRERQALENIHPDSALIKALPPRLHKGDIEPVRYTVTYGDRGEVYWQKTGRY